MRCVLAAAVVFTGIAEVSGFAPASSGGAARRGFRLHMQLDTPPPMQLLSAPVVAAQQAAALPRDGIMSRYEEMVGLNGGLLLANHEGGLDVPYKLMKVKDNKLLHMSAEEKEAWEKKLTGEERDEADVKRDKISGAIKLAALWLPLLGAAYKYKQDNVNMSDRNQAIASFILLLCVPINIVFSGMAYPNAEWEKVHEVLTWFVIWAPAIAIWSLTKVIDGLRAESSGRELAERR